MFQRLLALFAVALLCAACETASNVTGDSASDSSSSSATGSISASASESATAPSTTTSATQMSDAEKLAQVGNTVYFGFDSAISSISILLAPEAVIFLFELEIFVGIK
mgnify:CR=1 FL=1